MLAQQVVEKLCANDQVSEVDCDEIKNFIVDSFCEHGSKNFGSSFRKPLLYASNLRGEDGVAILTYNID
jgi:hypothetical protein